MSAEVLDLFSAAAGGWSLGMHRAGFTTIAACEVEAWRRALYSENNPEVRMYDDVRTLTAARLRDDLGRLPSIVVGSPPCQDISSANTKGRGVEGERSGLYFEAVRLIGEIRPRWFALENSSNLRTRGADAVLAALEALGYACWAVVVRAGDIGANHERPRAWLIGCDIEQVTDADGFGWIGRFGRGVGFDLSVSGDPSHADDQGQLRGPVHAEVGELSRLGDHCGRNENDARDPSQDGCGQGLSRGRAEPVERLPEQTCGDAADAAGSGCDTWPGGDQSDDTRDDGRIAGDDHAHGTGNTPDPDQAGQADGCMVPGIRQAEITDDGCCAGRSSDGSSAGQMGLCSPDSRYIDSFGSRWSIGNFTNHVWLDARLRAWVLLALCLEEGGMRWAGEQLIAAVKSAEHVERPSLDSDLATALRTVLAFYSGNTARRLAPIAATLSDVCSITLEPGNIWEKPAKSAKARTGSRSTTSTKTGPTATPTTSKPSARPVIPATICEHDLWAVHQRAERRMRLFASRQVEAFGDAVVPQIPEAIGRAILRTEAALAAIYQRLAA